MVKRVGQVSKSMSGIRRTAARQWTCIAGAVLSIGVAGGLLATAGAGREALLTRQTGGVGGVDDLVVIRLVGPDGSVWPMSAADVEEFDRAVSDHKVAGFDAVSRVGLLTSGGMAEPVDVEAVTIDYFDALEIAIVGRRFAAEETREPSSTPVAIVSRRLWKVLEQRPSSASAGVIDLGGVQFQVIGRAVAEFRGTRLLGNVDVWIPAAQRWRLRASTGAVPSSDSSDMEPAFFSAVARVEGDNGRSAVTAALRSVAPALERDPAKNRPVQKHFIFDAPLDMLHTRGSGARQALSWMSAAVGILVCVALANVLNDSVALHLRHMHDLATRLALGAPNGRVLRSVLGAAVLVALPTGLAAWVVAWSTKALAEESAVVPGLAGLTLRSPTWLVPLLSGVVAAVVFAAGALAVKRSVGKHLSAVARVRGSAAVSGWTRKLFTSISALQVAFSVALCVLTGAIILDVMPKISIDPGYDVSRIITVRVEPLAGNGGSVAAYYSGVIDAARGVPGVQSVTLAFLPPFAAGADSRATLEYETERGLDRATVARNLVEANYFETMGVPFAAGSGFQGVTALQGDGGRPVVLTAALAERLFGTPPKAIGRTMTAGGQKRTVIGVVTNTRQRGLLRERSQELLFEPLVERRGSLTAVVRTLSDAATLKGALAAAVGSVDRRVVVRPVTAADGVAQETAVHRFVLTVALILSVSAVVVALVGTYSATIRTLVEQRRDLLIRVALGAGPVRVLGGVFRRNIVVLLAGLIGGIVLARAANGLLAASFDGGPTFTWLPVAWVSGGTIVAGLCATVAAFRTAWSRKFTGTQAHAALHQP